jgi:hypothetical protein
MPINKISGGANNPPSVPWSLAAGEYFMLPTGQGILGSFGLVNFPQLASQNPFTGQYLLDLGAYSVLQMYDQGLQYWKTIASGNPYHSAQGTFSADGVNFRIANTTGCPVGAIITAAGSTGTNGFYGYTQFGAGQGQAVVIQNGSVASLGSNGVFTITPSAGGSLWNAIVGGAINTTISFSGTVYQNNSAFGGTGTSYTASAGSNYTKPPLIVFFPPPNQGQQPYLLPTATCTISGGAINAVTVVNQGMGLLGLPGIVVIPQPGDTTGGGAILGWTSGNSSQVGSGTLLGMWPAYYGTALTAVPTFTFGGSSNPAPTVTAIMNWTITAFGGTAGAGYGTTPGGVIFGGIVSGTAANTNPIMDKNLTVPLPPPINVTTATGVPTLAGPFQGSGFQATPSYCAIPNGTAAPGTANANTCTMGGASDTVQLMSF